jgi:outer membrane protein TolC
MRRGIASGGWAAALRVAAWVVATTAATSTAYAQAPAPPLPKPAPPAPGQPPPNQPDDTAQVPIPNELLQTDASGVTAEQAGARAAATSWSAKASEETMRAAAARVDEAWVAFLPRLSGLGRYTRLSNFTPPSLTSGGSLVGTLLPPNTPIGPNEVNGGALIALPSLSFPLVLDNWLLQGTINVPISDYFLRIDQAYTSATHSQDAARWDVVTQRAVANANGRLAYYAWMRARGAVIVAVEALNDQKTHLRDARNQFTVGNASKADQLRAETAVASAELAVERSRNLADLTEKQLRVAMHLEEGTALVPGEDIDSTPPPVQGNVKQMTLEALSTRAEIKSADANATAAHDTAAVQKAGQYPVFSAFADGIVANPNPRYFPATNLWFPTWDVGAQVTWSPNDTLVAKGGAADYESRAASIEANKMVVRDNIEVEVTQMLQAVHEADFAIDSSTRELASATEAYRVARELFNNGRGTSTTLTDAESELTRSRLDLLNAKVDARSARVRLDHALGRDVHVQQP